MIQTISFRGDRSPVPPRVKIGFESDNLVESLAFELPELAGYQSAMLMISGNAYANMIDLHRTEDGKWAVDLNAEMVGPAGVYESYVAITCPDGRRWNSGVFDLLTGDLPDISGAIETLYPTAVEHVLQEMADTRHEMAASVTASENAAQRAEDAAQRAENAANQGGGGEAPAKDAVLYTAQELTEEQQMQARYNIGAASEEAVGKLSEDKADRSEIPDPYVLPAATAETLGGVKIGAGLRMDGDVLNATGNGDSTQEGQFDLIKTVTVTAEQAAAEIKSITENLGQQYDALMVTVLDATPDVTRSIFVAVGKNWQIAGCGGVFQTRFSGRFIFRKLRGVWDIYGYVGLYAGESSSVGQTGIGRIMYVQPHTEEDSDYFESIGYVRVYTFGAPFVEGMKVNIYGARD